MRILLRLLGGIILRPFVPIVLLKKWLWLVLFAPKDEHPPNLTLILPKSMNPLEDRRPGPVFARRLDLAKEQHQPGESAFFVVGSKHRYRGISDSIPLWLAAKDYLKWLGVNKNEILFTTYPCYNGQTELVLGIRKCRELEATGRYHPKLLVVSAGYVKYRSLFCCIWHGYLPNFIWVDENNEMTKRKWFEETILFIYSLLDPDWQSPYSFMGWMTRRSREVKEVP